MLAKILLVGAGGFIGSVARYALALGFGRSGLKFPWHTLAANVIGCLLIGAVMFFVLRSEPSGRVGEGWRLFLAVGLLGGLTTFSTFSYETLALLRDGEPVRACLNVVLNLALCLGAVGIGWSIARAAV